MWVVEIDLISVSGIDLGLISVYGSKLPCFLCGGRKVLGFSVWIEINLVCVGASKLT